VWSANTECSCLFYIFFHVFRGTFGEADHLEKHSLSGIAADNWCDPNKMARVIGINSPWDGNGYCGQFDAI